MPASSPFWTYMIDAIGLGILLALIFIFRRRLQNCMSKFKICKQSVKRGREEDSGRRTPNKGLTDVAPSAPSCEDEPVEDVPTIISGPSIMYRPNARLAAEYLSEKYSIRPNHQPATPQSGETSSEKTTASTEHTLQEDSISGSWTTRTPTRKR